MNRKAALALLLASLAAPAMGAEPEAVVVRNRLYADQGRLEVGIINGLSVNNSLTSMYNPQLDVSYHFTEAWAFDLLLGYAFGGPTDLQCQAQNPGAQGSNCQGSHSIFAGAEATNKPFADLPNIWALNGPNAEAGLRWEPIYGKLSLLTELPVHFKWYLAADGGVAQFSRTSVDFCTNFNASGGGGNGDCAQGSNGYQTLVQSQYSWVASAATGFRFIFLDSGSIDLGLRDYVWADSFMASFTGSQFGPSMPAQAQIQKGLTNSLFADLGLSWTF